MVSYFLSLYWVENEKYLKICDACDFSLYKCSLREFADGFSLKNAFGWMGILLEVTFVLSIVAEDA